MALEDIPLFTMLRSRLSYLSERQRVIAENVANTDTPGYVPRDLRPFTLPPAALGQAGGAAPLGVTPSRTASNHLAGNPTRARAAAFRAQNSPDSETTMDGNAVVLEEEMMRMTEARMDFDAAIGFYQKSMNLLRLASRRPGQG